MNLTQKDVITKILPFALTLFVLWLQPWENQYEKLSDEWASCYTSYNGQCSYIGRKFKTNSFEWALSGMIHGAYGDEVCVRRNGFRNC